MADGLQFKYEDLQAVIDLFEKTRSGFESLAIYACQNPLSENDPVAEHHALVVKAQDQKLLLNAMDAFTSARDGAQEAYDTFKVVDAEGK